MQRPRAKSELAHPAVPAQPLGRQGEGWVQLQAQQRAPPNSTGPALQNPHSLAQQAETTACPCLQGNHFPEWTLPY